MHAEKRRASTLSRVLDALGRGLITIGLLMLGFVAYQLWGTGINEARQQKDLAKALQSPSSTVVMPDYGDAIGKMSIPAIGVDKYIVAGVDWKSLKKGPGLFPHSPLPGQLGNVAIAGHRTTFGAPFSRIDELKKGDTIIVGTPRGEFTYTVTGPPKIVAPSAVEVVRTTDESRAIMTLVSCHPKWTASRRIIVVAEMKTTTPEAATPFVPASDGDTAFAAGWFHDPAAWPAVIIFATLLAAIAALASLLVRVGWRRALVYPPALIVFLVVLYPFYENLARLLPTNI